MKLEDLEVGKCYTTWDAAEYLVCYKTNKWALLLVYSDAHYVASPMFINQDWLDQEWCKKLEEVIEWPITEFIDEFNYINEYTITNRDYED